MNLLGDKYGYIVGVWVLGLVGCAGPPQPLTPAPDVSGPPTVEAVAPASTPDLQGEIATPKADIWSQLQQADTHYYVMMRHAIAPGTGDPTNFQLDDCTTQRNLSAAGRAQARRTGAAFREKNVTVQRVLSSEWCRCLETAELMDLGPVERFPAVNSFFRDRAKEPERTRQLREFMVSNGDLPGVTVVVTHFVNIAEIAGSGVSSGELVVMQVNEQNEPEIVAQIEPF